MAIPKEYNIVVVGMGFIGGFLLPGYELMLGKDKIADHVFAVKATDRNLDELRQRFPFSITVNNLSQVLRETTPDLVIMCPGPKQIPGITREILLPYFNEAREKGIALPDIYTFGPSPDPKLYYDILGEDINCVKFLPSMAQPYKGVPLQQIGGSFLCFVQGHPFPEDRKQRAIAVSNLFGQTFLATHAQSLYGLSSKNTAHTCYEISYAISDVMQELGYEVTTSQVGSAIRSAFRTHAGLRGEGLAPCSLEAVPTVLQPFLKRLTCAWYDGILSYILSQGCEETLARSFHNANFELWALTIQLATREELEISTRNHATKGGVNEKAMEVFFDIFDPLLRRAIRAQVAGDLPESFYDTAQGVAFTIDLTVNRHAHRLANR